MIDQNLHVAVESLGLFEYHRKLPTVRVATSPVPTRVPSLSHRRTRTDWPQVVAIR